MEFISRNGVTTRKDGLPYDVTKIDGQWVLRATGNPEKPVVIAKAQNMSDAYIMLALQAPEGK